MATSTSSNRGTRRNGNDIDTQTEQAREAQEAVSRSLRASLDTAATLTQVSQRVSRELTELSLSAVKESMRLWAEMQTSLIDAVGTGVGNWSGQPAYQGFQRVLDGTTAAFGRFAESWQDRAEQGTEKIKEAVDVMADQLKESNKSVASAAR